MIDAHLRCFEGCNEDKIIAKVKIVLKKKNGL